MKKKLWLVISLLAVLCLFAGCGNSGKGGAEATTEGFEEPETTPIEISDPGQYVKLGQYEGLEIKRMSTEVTDEEVESEIRSNLGIEYKDVTDRDVVKKGDVVNVDYVTTVNGKEDEDWSDTDLDFPLDDTGYFNYVIDDVNGQFIGKKVGDSVVIDTEFNKEDETGHEGQKCTIEFTINAIKKQYTPKLTDEYVQENFGYDTVKEYKKEIRKEIEDAKKAEAEDADVSNLIKTIVDGSEIVKDFPATILAQAKSNIEIEDGSYAELYGMTLEDYLQEFYQMSEDELAVANLKQQCVWEQLIEKLDIKVTKKDIDAIVADYVEAYGSEEEVRETFSEDELREEAESEMLIKKLQEINKYVD